MSNWRAGRCSSRLGVCRGELGDRPLLDKHLEAARVTHQGLIAQFDAGRNESAFLTQFRASQQAALACPGKTSSCCRSAS
ncbi:hypothetical protein [Azotobacter beijerinckii]|uniref:hypothetical protein n=1 Tax=Azotobacter beijerinckii TaxID=170623 RepID=UPI002954C3A0|nr:hypothetical protein [Azotobacter beijerinckii]MDV7212616.1 hypothetical protein [Azotobacter beijerinckii]